MKMLILHDTRNEIGGILKEQSADPPLSAQCEWRSL
jgi:hypothetical protein